MRSQKNPLTPREQMQKKITSKKEKSYRSHFQNFVFSEENVNF